MHLVQQKGENALTSLASTNSDLRNAAILLRNEFEGLYTIHTALIYYKGRVIVA